MSFRGIKKELWKLLMVFLSIKSRRKKSFGPKKLKPIIRMQLLFFLWEKIGWSPKVLLGHLLDGTGLMRFLENELSEVSKAITLGARLLAKKP